MISYDDIKSGRAAVPVAKVTDTKAVVTQTITGKLPGMIRAAADKLAAATDAAEVLDARDEARLTYSTAQVAGRIAKAKGAHDQVVAAAHRAQADALEIEAEAKRRLADEYDGGQQRGEIAKKGKPVNVPDQNIKATAAEIGLTRKDVHDARRVRNAEQAQPGVVKAALEQAIAEGREPSRAVVNEAIAEALGEEKPAQKPRNIREELVALWCEADHEDRHGFIAYLRTIGFRISSSTGGSDVDRSAERASSAVEVGATNSPDGADEAEEVHLTGRGTRERGEHGANRRNGGAVERRISEGSPVGEAEDASVTSSGGENPAPNPNPQPKTPGDADKAEAVTPPPAVSANPFNNPRCQKPETCHLVHSRNECFDCTMAWAKRPRDEQVRLWAEAVQAARAA